MVGNSSIPRPGFSTPTKSSSSSRGAATTPTLALSKEVIIEMVLNSEPFANILGDLTANLKAQISEEYSEKVNKLSKRIEANESALESIQKSVANVQILFDDLANKLVETHAELKDKKELEIQSLHIALSEVSELTKRAHQEALNQQVYVRVHQLFEIQDTKK
jgi:predicted phage tail protein